MHTATKTARPAKFCTDRSFSLSNGSDKDALNKLDKVENAQTGKWKAISVQDLKQLPIPQNWECTLQNLEQHIGISFRDKVHLICALIHSGFISSHDLHQAHRMSNRSLEFLGDSLLGMGVAMYLFRKHPFYSEGKLTLTKAKLVSNSLLAKICVEHLHLNRYLLVADVHKAIIKEPIPKELDSRTAAAQWKGVQTIQAGAVEALIAAIYLDQGLATALGFVEDRIIPRAVRYVEQLSGSNPIVNLQKLLQKHRLPHPTYRHCEALSTAEYFTVELIIDGQVILAAQGCSYRAARLNAARKAYEIYLEKLS